MAGNGLSFHPDLYHSQGQPPPHLMLKVRRHHVSGWTLQGDRASLIGEHWPSAAAAVRAVRRYFERQPCTAHVTVYTPDNRAVFREIELVRR